MKIIIDIKKMQRWAQDARSRKKMIGFVPTMGYLHEGHLSLVRRAKRENDLVVVSIYVNPIQFGPKEDFKKYPRDFNRDADLCKKAGVDVMFAPTDEGMYPSGYSTYVEVEKLTEGLCGKLRPGHFKGVTTVVTKLFNIAKPHNAYFGQKDAQQAIVVKHMAEDLNMDLKVKICPTLREPDGLAMSSRNVYLSPVERRDALVLNNALQLARNMVKSSTRSSKAIVDAMRRLILKKKAAKIEYVDVVDPETLQPIEKIKDKALIALAVWVGKTRLIDNKIVKG